MRHPQTQRSAKRKSSFGYFSFKKSDRYFGCCTYPKTGVYLRCSVRLTAKERIMAGKAFSREVRKRDILNIFYKRFEDNEVSEMTSSQVARKLGLEPSHHVRGLLSELVRDGNLSARECYDNRNKNLLVGRGDKPDTSDGRMFYFRLSDSERTALDKKMREVPVKISGKMAGQLKLL